MGARKNMGSGKRGQVGACKVALPLYTAPPGTIHMATLPPPSPPNLRLPPTRTLHIGAAVEEQE